MGGEFWTDGYFASTVGKHGDEAKIAMYVKNQGQEYIKLYEVKIFLGTDSNAPQLAAGILYQVRYYGT